MMLVRWADLQSLVYMVLYPSLMAWQWIYGIQWYLYLLMLVLSVGLSVVQHNHTHLRMWRWKPLNRLTDAYLSVIQGIPSYVFFPSHIGNHHRFNHGPEDETRTYRFGGHHNHLIGYLLHPFQALTVVVPTSLSFLKKRSKKSDYQPIFEIILIGASAVILASVNVQLWFVLVILPQMHGLHWLLGANYLQHAGARPSSGPEATEPSTLDYSRNFTGAVNWIWFNIGYHSAHHESPREHWSDLPVLHERKKSNVPEWLIERSLMFYMLRWMNVFSRKSPRNFHDLTP
jgi:fatty acid desaturase